MNLRAADSPEVVRLVEGALDLVHQIAERIYRSCGCEFELDDLKAAGREGLLDAARRFYPKREVPFSAFARRAIYARVHTGIQQTAPLSRGAYHRAMQMVQDAQQVLDDEADSPQGSVQEQLQKKLESCVTAMALRFVRAPISLDEVADNTDALKSEQDTPEEAYFRGQDHALILDCLNDLRPTEAAIIRQIYFHHRSAAEVARELDVSRSWVSRWHKKALKNLRSILLSRSANRT